MGEAEGAGFSKGALGLGEPFVPHQELLARLLDDKTVAPDLHEKDDARDPAPELGQCRGALLGPGRHESPTGEVADHRPRIEGGRSAGWLFEGCRCQGLGFGLLGYR